jgi:hypothetical protein
MYRSLMRHSPGCRLYIFAFDDLALHTLRSLDLTGVTVISLDDFETDELRAVKRTRTMQEYCWTCTPYVITHVLDRFREPECTYIDADLFFYGDPGSLLGELGDHSVLITPHWYTPSYDSSQKYGIYCVQFVTFRDTEQGRAVLNWWRAACHDWCYSRIEEGKFGDQKYLDDWPERFTGVRVAAHRGGGVAPWNVQQYSISNTYGQLTITMDSAVYPLVFYHYHYVRFYRNGIIDLGPFDLPKNSLELLYRPYLKTLHLLEKEVIQLDKSLKSVHQTTPYSGFLPSAKYLIRRAFFNKNFLTPNRLSNG